jgi:hypothetical protein
MMIWKCTSALRRACTSNGIEWVNVQRLYEEDEDFSAEAVENGTTERQMRNQFDAWVKIHDHVIWMHVQEAAE